MQRDSISCEELGVTEAVFVGYHRNQINNIIGISSTVYVSVDSIINRDKAYKLGFSRS